jgi:hypothetical protein
MAAPGLGVRRRPRLRAAPLLASPGASLRCKIKRSGHVRGGSLSWAGLGGRAQHQDPVFPYLVDNQLAIKHIFE